MAARLDGVPHAAAVVDLDAIRANVGVLLQHARAGGASPELMAVVKADGYGHGLVPSARAALAGGASWLGVAMVDEALALRSAGVDAPILAWLWAPQDTGVVRQAVLAGVDISASSPGALDALQGIGREDGRPARVHLKIDTGLSRNGAPVAQWPYLVAQAAQAQADGTVEVVGIWSHFVHADAPGHDTISAQIGAFHQALDVAAGLGVVPRYRHLANSAATLTRPEAHFDLVRPGVAVYGLSPVPELGAFGLRPAMTLQADVALAKRVAAGSGLSYGHQYVTPRETTVALVPLGYADGVPRDATNVGPVAIRGIRYRVSGRVCMDQFVVDVGDDPVDAGDRVVLFGPGSDGEPTAQDWADALGTIHYEIVTRIGPRVPRRYVGLDAAR